MFFLPWGEDASENWNAYVRSIYRGADVESLLRTRDLRNFTFFYNDVASRVGAHIPGPSTDCARTYNDDHSFADGSVGEFNWWIGYPDTTKVWKSSLLQRTFATNDTVEVIHTNVKRSMELRVPAIMSGLVRSVTERISDLAGEFEEKLTWMYPAPGSGTFLSMGRTRVFDTHHDLLRWSDPGMKQTDMGSVPLFEWDEEVIREKCKEEGIDTVQIRHRREAFNPCRDWRNTQTEIISMRSDPLLFRDSALSQRCADQRPFVYYSCIRNVA
jgi:hypothetical protein